MQHNSLYKKNVVCLGGGVGTSNLLRGIKHYQPNITVITSMADDGGSSGRLRKTFKIMPPGDIVSSIAALISDENSELADLLIYRFPGSSRQPLHRTIDGHKFGNLLMLAELQRTKNFYKAIEVTKKLFGVKAELLPATDVRTRLSAITKDGRRVHSETTLDLAKYSQPHGLKKIYLTPKFPKVNNKVRNSILQADLILSGPGDLYTNQLPVMIIPQIAHALKESRCLKVFIINIANKPVETKGYAVHDFIQAVDDHLGFFPFQRVLINNNYSTPIPNKLKYSYVKNEDVANSVNLKFKIISKDLVNEKFPLYHDSRKLARTIDNLYNKYYTK